MYDKLLLECDTTSRVFGIGKPIALKKHKTSEYFRGMATHFKHPQAIREDIFKAGAVSQPT